MENYLVNDIIFWDFSNGDFIGKYVETTDIGNDVEKFTVHVFQQKDTNELYYLPNVYSINKALDKAKNQLNLKFDEEYLKISFLGKTEVNGRPFNRYAISIFKE